MLGDHPHERWVLVWCNLAIEQDGDTETRGFECVAVRGVQEILAPVQFVSDQRRKIYAGRNAVRIQRANAARQHILRDAPAILEPPADKSALILYGIALFFAGLLIFLGGFRCANRGAVSFLQVTPRVFLVLVFQIRFTVANRDLDDLVHLHRLLQK